MKRSSEILLSFLRAGLGGEKPSLPSDMGPGDWFNLFTDSCGQAVQGVVFDAVALFEDEVPSELLVSWKRVVANLEDTYALMGNAVTMEMEKWRENGIETVLLKGLESASFYPHPEHRVNGDIDLWLPRKEDWGKARSVLEERGIDFKLDSDGDMAYGVGGGIVVELHREGLRMDGPAGVLLLLCEHILHHAMVFGVGLRQICDYRLALEHYKGTDVEVEFREAATDRGLGKWLTVLDSLPEPFLEIVLEDGNFGFSRGNRVRGIFRRLSFFMKVAPGALVKRWTSLAMGRVRKLLGRS